MPGTGKTTIIENLKRRGLFAFDIEEIEGLCYWRNKTTFKRTHYHSGVSKDWINEHEWVSDIDKLKEIINNHNGLVITGGIVENQNEFLPLFNNFFLLQCKENTLIRRLKERIRKDEYGKTTIEQEMILNSYRKFEKNLIDRGAITINTGSSLDEITNKILSIIQ